MKTLQVYSNSEAHEDAIHHYYDLIKDGEYFTLNTSNSDVWQEDAQEEFRASLVDHGNGAIIKLRDTTFSVDYSQAFELLILLLSSVEDRVKIVEQTTILEL